FLHPYFSEGVIHDDQLYNVAFTYDVHDDDYFGVKNREGYANGDVFLYYFDNIITIQDVNFPIDFNKDRQLIRSKSIQHTTMIDDMEFIVEKADIGYSEITVYGEVITPDDFTLSDIYASLTDSVSSP